MMFNILNSSFSVDDSTATAIVYCYGNLVRQLLALSVSQWTTLQQLVKDHEVNYDSVCHRIIYIVCIYYITKSLQMRISHNYNFINIVRFSYPEHIWQTKLLILFTQSVQLISYMFKHRSSSYPNVNECNVILITAGT